MTEFASLEDFNAGNFSDRRQVEIDGMGLVAVKVLTRAQWLKLQEQAKAAAVDFDGEGSDDATVEFSLQICAETVLFQDENGEFVTGEKENFNNVPLTMLNKLTEAVTEVQQGKGAALESENFRVGNEVSGGQAEPQLVDAGITVS